MNGHAGSFVIEHRGTYSDKTTQASWEIIPGSGTGALQNIFGKGTASTKAEDKTHTFTLSCDLRKA